jgi:hypothetical protein
VTQARVERPRHGRRCASPQQPMARRGWCAGLVDWRHLARSTCHEHHGGVHADIAQQPVVTPAPRHACLTRVRHVRQRSDVVAHDVALGVRSSVREQKQFAESVFKIDFLHFLKLKCTLHKIAKLKIIYSSTTSAKAIRVFAY